MLRILHPFSYAETLPRAHRLGALPRCRLIVVARWLVTVLLVWLILRSIDTAAVLNLIARATLPDFALAGLVVALQVTLLVWRWQLVIRILGGEAIGLGPLSVILGHSLLVGQVLPSSLGGDVARTVMLARLTGAAVAARSVVCDRLLGSASLALLVIPTLPITAGGMGGLTPMVTLTTAALGAIAVVVLVLAFPFIIHAIPWLKGPLTTAAGDLRLMLCSGKASLAGVALAVSANLLSVLLIYILGSAIGAELKGLDCLVLVPPALLASALPISLGGWGVREGTLLAAFSLVQANPARVAAMSVMYGLATPLAGATVVGASLFADWRAVRSKGSRDE
jgi:uncharacterized membrane protein YbhN (UPF0104 family)